MSGWTKMQIQWENCRLSGLCFGNGEITSEILVEILKFFDDADLFPHIAGGPIPVLIGDGHQSCLDPKFVEYINDEVHQWKVCLGVPYATTLWQVGDALNRMEW